MIGTLLKESVMSNGIATACSFASILTNLSSLPQRYEAINLSTSWLG